MRVPTATYRLQFRPGFGFREAREVAAYLHELGISHVYASPIFQARKDSPHGYDVVDMAALNPQLGTPEDFEALMGAVRGLGLGWIQDIVPNHMAFSGENVFLMRVFEQGTGIPEAGFFDVDWDHPYANLRGRILAPFLGSFYAEALESGEIRLVFDRDGLAVRYYDLRFPLRLSSYRTVFLPDADAWERRLGRGHEGLVRMVGAVSLLDHLASARGVGPDEVRHAKDILWDLYETHADLRALMDEAMARYNGVPGRRETFQALDDLLSVQCFRLAFWKVAAEEINYRRFFTINDIISLRVQDPEVFDRTHALILRRLGEGRIDGLRVDHIDGLYDPEGYLRRLRDAAGDAFIVVEKILGEGEALRGGWPVQGTTGYDFLNAVNRFLCDGRGERPLSRLYHRFTRLTHAYEDLTHEKRRLIIGRYMAGDIDNLALSMKRVASRDRYGRDITLYGLRRALVEVMACFPVYRTYIGEGGGTPEDAARIRAAIGEARRRHPEWTYELRFIGYFLSLEIEAHLDDEERRLLHHFIRRFQQFTAPLAAKGFEDTVLYIYNKLTALNEVGGDPGRFALAPGALHRFFTDRLRTPHTLNATATHDTKRGEDTRARIAVLSEIPGEWDQVLRVWRRVNRGKKGRCRGRPAPDPNDEYLFYQTLLGTFPFDGRVDDVYRDRIRAYVVKAVREAKVHTAWIAPDSEYEEACLSFIEKLLRDQGEKGFLAEFRPFQRRVAFHGMLNGLTQTLLKMTAPGVPDFYQGCELWDLSLVDPDNRRPVDFDLRRRFLDSVRAVEADPLRRAGELLADMTDGRVKMYLIRRGLEVRRRHSRVFQEGDYRPLAVEGARAGHAFAFSRTSGRAWTAVVVPYRTAGLVPPGRVPTGGDVWEDTTVRLPHGAPRRWREVFSNQVLSAGEEGLRVGEALAVFPCALLLAEPDGSSHG